MNRPDFLVAAAASSAAVGLGLVSGDAAPAQRTADNAMFLAGANAELDRRQARLRRLTPTPPLGWNSYDSYGCPSFKDSMANMDAMAAKLKPFGYEYFVLDSGWGQESEKDPAGVKPPQWQWHAPWMSSDALSRAMIAGRRENSIGSSLTLTSSA